MRLNNGNKIITEDDIILSDGKTLSERMSSQQSEIDMLKSNVKWIYKYGGVGSGSGGGGTIQSFSIYATLNNVQLKDQTIVLNGEGNYQLYIKINNPNGAQFNVQYTYTTRSSTGNTITQSQTQILSIENNYTLSTQIHLNNNDLLTIVASDGNNTQQVSCNYVTSAYIFTPYLVDDNNNPLQNEIFISNARTNGINVKLDYTISVNADIQYTYTFEEETLSGNISDKNNSILFPISDELFQEENAGYYTATIQINVIPENQDPVTLNYSVQFNLIPEDLYMLVTPQSGVIYKTEVEDPIMFSPGYITFNYRIYEGISQNRQYNVTVQLNGALVEDASATVTERQQNQFRIFTVQAGVNTLTVTATRSSTYTQTYYFYVEKSSMSLDWFDNPSEWTKYYYRLHETTSNFDQFKGKLYIEQTVNSSPITISNTNPPNISGNSIINTHIAIGLQYNAINGDNSNIMQFFNSNSGSTPVFSINQETVTSNSVDRNLYIQKQDDCNKDEVEYYHLIQIYSQYVKQIGNDFYYEISLYIDGILEQVFPQVYSSPLLITSFTIQPVNCFINLLEIDYKEGKENNNCDYEVFKYYIKYKNEILRLDVASELQLTEYLPNFVVGLNGRVTTDYSTINNIANHVQTPTLVMTYENSGQYEDFMASLEQNYGEDGSMPGADMNFPVTLQWSAGNSGLTNIQFPSGYNNAQYRAALQGSSTKLYRVKNFTLSLENTDDSEQAEVYLYSPNFKNGDQSTFLPEKEFTLKADVVDSSHSNNTSCGRFVNTVCRKFSQDISENGYYADYIRNCLEGFPILLYLCVVETNPETQERTQTYYYLGIYNFNLGRSSYYNLGYKDLSVFGDNSNHLLTDAGSSFTFFKITKSEDILREGLGVAEIQGGSNYFDFSQYDPSILFQQALSGQYVDNTYMFGDLVFGSNSTELQLQSNISDLVKKIALSGGYLFDYIKKKRGSYDDGYKAEKQQDGQYTGESLNQVPDYTKQYQRKMNNTGSWEYSIKEEISPGTSLNLQELIIPNPDEQRLAALNYQSLAEYYTICMVLGLVDSVQKNLNIKTWNNQTWYLAFYDMDTCLGINNQGSDINYFAFSDYWHNQSTTEDGTDYPEEVRIYRDFSPNSMGENGYDIPSSYLFAVAKYAKLIYKDSSDESSAYTAIYPQELYAKWRSNTINNETNEGILKNADYFVDNFFSNNLGSVNPALVSYNYRSKYLSLGGTQSSVTWINTDYNKFNGTRINKVREWFNGRLHILDVYFNLNRSVINTIQYLDEDGQWQTLMEGDAPVTDVIYSSNYSLAQNRDIVILHDIFSDDSSSAGVQLSGRVDIKIKCPEYSPLQIYNANNTIRKNYILGGDNYQQIQFQTTGVQGVKLGGSQAWTYLESINWLSADTLLINSDKLENIMGTSGSFSSIQLTTPNVKTIELTSPNYRGTLSLQGSQNFPNISSVNISRSNMNLNLNNVGVTYVNVSNIINSQATVTIIGCDKLETFTCTGSTLASLNITGIKGNLKNFSISNTNISSIQLECQESGGSVSITNDNSVESITLSGFETVVIDNCPKLKKVVFNISDIATKSVQVSNCIDTSLLITSTTTETPGVVDLTQLSGLSQLNLYNSYGIKEVYLPDNVILSHNAFYNLYNLTSLDGNNIQIVGRAVFNQCNQYNMRTKEGGYTDLHVSSSNTDISSLFRRQIPVSNITIDDVKHFIETAIPSDNNITNISNLFYNNEGIIYGLDQLKADIVEHANNYIDMTKFSKVTDATQAFALCKITAYSKDMWNLGSSSGINLKAFCEPLNSNTPTIYTTIDLLQNVVSKVTRFFDSYYIQRIPITFIDNTTGEIIPQATEIKLKDFFNPGGTPPSKLQVLRCFFLNTDQTFDFTDTFTAAWTSLTTISEFMWKNNCRYKGVDKLFYNLPSLRSLDDVLLPSILDEKVNLFTIINWQYFLNRGGSFAGCDIYSYSTGSFTLNKYISAADYVSLCNMMLKSNIQDISYLFTNCVIVGYSGEFTFGTDPTVNNTIKKVKGLYKNCKLSNSQDGSAPYPMQLSSTFFKGLYSVADVRYAFYGCSFSNPIPFNFFNKRQLDQTVDRNVWVKVGDQYEPAVLYQYTYRDDIYNYSYLFANCEWTNTSRQYDPAKYTIDRSKVLYNDTDEYTTYYTRIEIPTEEGEPQYQYTEHTIEQPTEITDAENLTGYYVASVATGSGTWSNCALVGDSNKLCIPPDLFYGTANVIPNDGNNGVLQYDYALACTTTLQGIIPEHIFSKNNAGSVSNTFRNQDIIPRLIDSLSTEAQNISIYSHFPANYVNYTNLNNAFNCNPVVPINSYSGEIQQINWVLIILDNTIPSNVASMQNAFNFTTSNLWYNGQGRTDDNYINYIGNVSGGTIDEGFNITKFTQLNLDKMLYGRLTSLIHGRIFNVNFDAKNMKLSDVNNYIMECRMDNSYISAFLQFPRASGNIQRLMTMGIFNARIKSNQITDLSNSRQYYEQAGFIITD